MDDPLYLDNSENNQNLDHGFGILQKNNLLDNMETSDVLDIILQRDIPAYLPPTHEYSRANDMLYICHECMDKFLLETSLNQHINRRCVLITLHCPYCRQNLEFYNRCRFLEHFRCQHPTVSVQNIPPESINLQSLRLPLDWGVKQNSSSNLKSSSIASPPILTPLSKQVSTSVTIKNISLHGNTNNSKIFPTKSLITPSTSTNHIVTPMESGTNFPPGSSCHECGEKTNQMQSHYLGANVPSDEYCCIECPRAFPTKCSLAAHIRVHSKKRPFICPDCTCRYSDLNSFIYHLNNICFHEAKLVVYCCPICNQLCKTLIALQAHFSTRHVKNVYKCNVCEIAHFNIESLKEHKAKIHQKEIENITIHHQCQLCPEQIHSKANILFHVTDHCNEPNYRKFAYHCSKCNLLTSNKNDFANHEPCKSQEVEEKPELGKCFVCGNRLLYSVPPESQEFIPRCNECIRETNVVIKNRNGKDILFLKKYSDPKNLIQFPKQEKVLVKTFEKSSENKFHTCHVCKSQLSTEWSKIQSHYNKYHPGNNVMLLKGLNGSLPSTSTKPISSTPLTSRKMKNHASDPGISYEDDSNEEISSYTPRETIKKLKSPNVINYNKRPTTGQLPPAKKRKRTVSDRRSSDEEPFSSGQILKTPNTGKNSTSNGTSKKKQHTCLRCGHSEKDLKTFRLHVATHRDPNSPFLCLECGSSFVVKPSLSKHLHCTHRIRDVEAYLREHGLKETGEREEVSATLVNKMECRVCHESMGSQAALAKHLKVHGMGFLRLRGARGAPVSRETS